MNVSEWEKSHWERSTKNMHLLLMEDSYLLAKIHFLAEKKRWEICLFKKYSETHLSPQIRIQDFNRAKKFTTMILGEGIIDDPNWQDYSKTTAHLYDRLDGELLAMLNFDLELKSWHTKVLRREYTTYLNEKIGVEWLDQIKKVTKDLVKAEPYEYMKIIKSFESSRLK